MGSVLLELKYRKLVLENILWKKYFIRVNKDAFHDRQYNSPRLTITFENLGTLFVFDLIVTVDYILVV